MNDNTGKLENLPKWAQQRIASLERKVALLQAHINYLELTFPDSNVKVSYFGQKDQGLPDNSRICFYLGASREKYRDMITVNHTQDGKTLRVSSSGHLTIRPAGGSNVIELAIEGF